MSLRRRTLLIVLMLLVASLLILSAAGGWLVYPNFVALEREQARRNAELVLEVSNHELELLARKPEDWGYWDDTYRFVQDRNPVFVEDNLQKDSQVSLGVNLLAFYDRAGNRIWARAMDLDSGREYELGRYTAPSLPADDPYLAHEDQPHSRAGLVQTPRGVMLLASTPILDSQRRGPRAGTLIVGRYFDNGAIRRILRQARMEFRFSPAPPAPGAVPAATGSGETLRHSAPVFSEDAENSFEDAIIFGVDGRPTLGLRVETPRDISRRGRDALAILLAGTVFAGVGIALALIVLLDAFVVSPLARLTAQMRKIGASDDELSRLQLDRSDELGELAAEFDRMLDRLADARQRLRRESYRSGASEMAGGIVQELADSLAPVHDQLAKPVKLLDQAHTSVMQALARELGQPGLSHHRSTELLAQLQDRLDEQEGLLSESRAELRSLRKQLESMSEKVAEYSRYAGAGAKRAPVRWVELLDSARRRSPESQRQWLSVRVDESLQRLPPVAASREVLLRVLVTLVASLSTNGDAEPVEVRVSADVVTVDGRELVRLRFDDERPPGDVRRLLALFDRPAGESPGLAGLSWAENAVSAMGGRLSARAAEDYGGLQVTLSLPKAG